MGWKQSKIVSLEHSVKELTALRVSDNNKFVATLAKERQSHQEATKGLSEAVVQLQVILEALKGLVAKNEDVPASFTKGLEDCDAGRTVDMEKALVDVPVTFEIPSDELQERYSKLLHNKPNEQH